MKLRQILNNRKGFTLMEIIVVLIIVAVLAAALIPSFVNFARQSRASQYIAEARVGLTAAQTIVTEAAATDATLTAEQLAGLVNAQFAASDSEFHALLTDDVSADGVFTGAVVTGLRVSGLQYDAEGWRIIIHPATDTEPARTEAIRP